MSGITVQVVAFLLLSLSSTDGNENAKRLFDELLSKYNKLLRPVKYPQDILTIRLKLRLSQIIDVHEKDQIMTSSVWLRQDSDWQVMDKTYIFLYRTISSIICVFLFVNKRPAVVKVPSNGMIPSLHGTVVFLIAWHSVHARLFRNPVNYGNVSVLYVPASIIWTPDIVLYNNADSTYNITISTKATLRYTGLVIWEPPALFKSMCPIEVKWFPFDAQVCHLKFGSWSYSEEVLDLQHLDANVTYSKEQDLKTGEVNHIAEVENGIDLSEYYPSVEWDILRIPARRHGKTYPSCCPESLAYIDITYFIHLRRKPLFYTVNLIFPCIGISLLTVVVFYLPSDTGEKISLSISILVSLTVFFLLLTEIIPSSSIVLPLICKYLLFTMVMVTLSVLVTIMVLNVHFRRPTIHRMPNWVRIIFLHYMPKWLFMRRKMATSRPSYSFSNCCANGVLLEYPSSPSSLSTSTLTTPLLSPVPSCRKTGPMRALNLDEAYSMCNSTRSTVDCEIIEASSAIYANPHVLRAFDNIRFIAALLQNRHEDTQNEEDWKYVAMVIDRLLLLVFAAACFIGTVTILLQAPSLYDYTQPIDTNTAHFSQH